MAQVRTLMVIDGNSLLYRAFHALPPLTNKKGKPTGAVYGFLLILFRAMKDIKASHIVACFDTPKPTFRHKAFDDYKAQRPSAPEGIVVQIPVVKEVLASLNIPVFEREGFEADDLIATITERGKETGFEVYVVSGDLDNLQLVGESVKLYTMSKGIKDSVVYDPQKVVDRFGVQPGQMNDFKALTGDASDNIPGVPGIGKTTAAELIQRYWSIKNLYDELATDTVVAKPKVKEALKQNREKAFLSLQLVETKKDIPLPITLEACRFGGFDIERARAIFKELDFTTLMNKLSTITF